MGLRLTGTDLLRHPFSRSTVQSWGASHQGACRRTMPQVMVIVTRLISTPLPEGFILDL